MKIISDYTKDTGSIKLHPGSYEWWYFDGLTADGEYGIVVIFYEGNPFSRRYLEAIDSNTSEAERRAGQFPALSISVYQSGRPIYYGFCEHEPDEARFDSERIHGRVGESEFGFEKSNGKLVYTVSLDQVLPGGDSIRGSLKFISDDHNIALVNNKLNENINDNDAAHTWNLVQPAAMVTGELKIDGFRSHAIRFEGPGYHDHNFGRESMDRSFLDWYWGRFHFPESVFVYYIMQKQDGDQHRAWLIQHDGEVIRMDDHFQLDHNSLNPFGLMSARKITIEGSGVKCLVQKEKVLDNGPFYQRFMSRAVMEAGDGISQANGFAEYIHPARIKNRLFRPLVNMRIAYPGGKPHWVQRNPRLYRWTW